jgi:hypothetical protein
VADGASRTSSAALLDVAHEVEDATVLQPDLVIEESA